MLLLNLASASMAAALAAGAAGPAIHYPPLFAPPVPPCECLLTLDDRFRMYEWRGGCPAASHTHTKAATLEAFESCWAVFLPHA